MAARYSAISAMYVSTRCLNLNLAFAENRLDSIGTGIGLTQLSGWVEEGTDWLAMGEYGLMIQARNQVSAGVRS